MNLEMIQGLALAGLFVIAGVLVPCGLFTCYVLWTMWKEDRFRYPEGKPTEKE